MNIALDFDDTYTRDPEGWDYFIKLFQSRGHIIYCVTSRGFDTWEVYATIGEIVGRGKCIFTGFKAKKDWVSKLGIRIDVWINDNPFFILNGVQFYGS
jgi:hypothetical protein